MSAQIEKIEIRSLPSTINGNVAFTAIYLTETLNDYLSHTSTDRRIIVPYSSLQGSLIVSYANDSGDNIFSPLLANESDVIFEDYNLYRSDFSTIHLRNDTVDFTSISPTSNVFIVAVVTSDSYVSWSFINITPHTSLEDNYIYSLCTSTRYGYVKGKVEDDINLGSRGSSNFDNTARKQLFDISDEYEQTSDPYDDGGTSDGGGGTGDFDDTSDTVSEPSLPTISGLNTGFFTAFVCSNSDMQNISNYLWNNLMTDILDPSTQMADKIDALKSVVANPYDAIMGCSIIPVSPTIAGSKEVKMYGLIETGISLNYAGSRWVRVDCGTLNINEYWGAYLDYSPYTKTTSLYLPYIGTVSIDIDLIMGKALQVIYHVDILSGICIAYILINGSVEFQYQGQCSTQIPITNADYSGTIQAGIGLVGNVSNIVAGGVGGASGGIAGAVAGATANAVSQTPSIVGNVMGMKPDIKSGGSVGSAGGILGVQKPYLIIERPRQSLPKAQNSYTGYPCNRQMKVSDCLGYTEFEDIKLENIPLTDGEKEELKQILSEGVILA